MGQPMGRRVSSLVCCAVSIALCSWPGVALAEPTAADKALATQLFKDGRKLVDEGHIPEGCRKLEESQRLDAGGGTLLNLALCHEKEGRTATAWAEFTEALGIARRDGRTQRIEIAQTHIASLEPLLSHLIVRVSQSTDLPELEIVRDGSKLPRAAWGTAMPVDPGEHVIEASAPGKVAYRQVVMVQPASGDAVVTIPVLTDAPMVRPMALVQPAVPSSATGGSRAPAWVAMAFGAVGLGAGTYFGLSAISKQKTADKSCSTNLCNDAGATANDQAIRFANFATVGFVVGAVGIGLGTVLLLTSGPASSHRGEAGTPTVNVAVSEKGSELTVGGRW
jgi:hypothetical protein